MMPQDRDANAQKNYAGPCPGEWNQQRRYLSSKKQGDEKTSPSIRKTAGNQDLEAESKKTNQKRNKQRRV